MFNWIWKKNRIAEVVINETTNGANAKCVNVFNSSKILGVCMSYSLSQNDEYEHVELKLKRFIKNLIAVDVKLQQVRMCFSIHVVNNLFFGCVFARFKRKQCDGLKKMCELQVTRKMKLGVKFPTKFLHVRKSNQALSQQNRTRRFIHYL